MSGFDGQDNEIVVPVKGRTGQSRAKASAKVTLLEDGSLHFRLDDENNMEFWAELTIPLAQIHWKVHDVNK